MILLDSMLSSGYHNAERMWLNILCHLNIYFIPFNFAKCSKIYFYLSKRNI